MLKKIIILIVAAALAASASLHAQNNVQRYVDTALKTDTLFKMRRWLSW